MRQFLGILYLCWLRFVIQAVTACGAGSTEAVALLSIYWSRSAARHDILYCLTDKEKQAASGDDGSVDVKIPNVSKGFN